MLHKIDGKKQTLSREVKHFLEILANCYPIILKLICCNHRKLFNFIYKNEKSQRASKPPALRSLAFHFRFTSIPILVHFRFIYAISESVSQQNSALSQQFFRSMSAVLNSYLTIKHAFLVRPISENCAH